MELRKPRLVSDIQQLHMTSSWWPHFSLITRFRRRRSNLTLEETFRLHLLILELGSTKANMPLLSVGCFSFFLFYFEWCDSPKTTWLIESTSVLRIWNHLWNIIVMQAYNFVSSSREWLKINAVKKTDNGRCLPVVFIRKSKLCNWSKNRWLSKIFSDSINKFVGVILIIDDVGS